MSRRFMLVVACVAVAFLSGPAWAKRAVVKTTDGRSIEGEVDDSKPDWVVVTQKGGTTIVQRDQIDTIAWIDSVEDEYQRRLADLPNNADASDHIALARWLFNNKAYELARRELDAALRLDPSNSDANTLYQTVEGQLRLDRSRAAVPAAPDPVVATTSRPATGPNVSANEGHTAAAGKYLTAGQVNTVKQWEWWQFTNDTGVRVRLNGDVVRRYLDSDSKLNRADFNQRSIVDQGIQILQHGTPEMKKSVIVLNDPSALAEFRRSVQPLVLAGCAAAGCHGGSGGGNFFLYPQAENPEAAYTNFYLLGAYGRTSHGLQKMIDRTRPDASLLLAYSLPAEAVDTPHPTVPKNVAWRGVFKSRDDARYRTIFNWLSNSLNHLESPDHVGPDYGFAFSLDAPAASTAPATQTGAQRGADIMLVPGTVPPATQPGPATQQ